jgi:hypothetical protein
MSVKGGLQRRLEESSAGRAVLSALILFTLAGMLVSNLPPSELRRTGMKALDPFLDVSGLHQNWNLFAPDPRRTTLQLEARIRYADGSVEVWHPPTGDPVIGAYRSFRWRKWAGNVLSSDHESLLKPTADWLAETHAKDGRLPVEVVIVKRFYVAPPPGSGRPARQPWKETVLYTGGYEGSPA